MFSLICNFDQKIQFRASFDVATLFNTLDDHFSEISELFHAYHIETSPLIYFANQWTGVCMIGASVMKDLIHIFL